jgi:hypothetical protein
MNKFATLTNSDYNIETKRTSLRLVIIRVGLVVYKIPRIIYFGL